MGINSEEEASDGTFGKIISGSALVSIFAGLIGVYIYYGGDGLLAATAKQRSLSGHDGGLHDTGALDYQLVRDHCTTSERPAAVAIFLVQLNPPACPHHASPSSALR